jgi:hypothetical protein
MTDSSIARITGMFGVACVLLSWAQFPLWVIGGAPPFCDREALARHLSDIRTTAFIRILMDQGIYVSTMIFASGFRHLVRRARPESDWLGVLALVSAAVWLAVTLAADIIANFPPDLVSCRRDRSDSPESIDELTPGSFARVASSILLRSG